MLEWIERTANDFTEEVDENQVAWSDQEAGSSEDEAPAKRAKQQGVTAALGRLLRSGKISEGPTAALGGPSNSETQSIVSGGARSALGRPLYPAETPSRGSGGARSALGRPLYPTETPLRGSAVEESDTEGSTVQTEPRGKWPLGRPRHAKGVS